MTDEDDAASVGFHTIESSVSASNIQVSDDEMNFISAAVDIEVSGSDRDHGHTALLHQCIEEAVSDTLRDFSGGDE